jgi:UDP-N-acetylenolpyruvoylglucosamine reductase
MVKTKLKTTRCAICRHIDRRRIEMSVVGGASVASVAKKFTVHHMALHRHMGRHVDSETKINLIAGPIELHELAERAAAEGMSLLDYLVIIRSTLMNLLVTAAGCGDRTGSAMLAGRVIECLREIGKLTGELHNITHSVTNNTLIMESPIIADLQASILGALREFPEARARVLSEMQRMDAHVRQIEAPMVAAQRAPEVIDAR